jgi:hypothetical protein
LLEQVRHSVLPAMKRNEPLIASMVDDAGFPKEGTHSVGVMPPRGLVPGTRSPDSTADCASELAFARGRALFEESSLHRVAR